MRILIAAALAFTVSACGGISERISETTGTTLEQRCANYRASVDQWEAYRAAGNKLTEERLLYINGLRSFITLNCPAELPPAVPVPAPAG